MNTGIQDAYNLGWKLAGVCDGRYLPTILDTHNAERHPVAKALLQGTDRSYRGILHSSELQQRLVRMFGPFIVKVQAAQELMAATPEELSIAYASTPLNADFGGTEGSKPGEHARVDAHAVRFVDKRTVRLADVTRDAEWVYLAFGGLRDQAEPARPLPDSLNAFVSSIYVSADTDAKPVAGFDVLVDAEEELHRSYGVRAPAAYLLRPDGVVALRSPADGLENVTDYFRALLQPQPV